MSLQFIAGGSGSGKTRYLYEKVIKESEEHLDIQYLFIVPEQYTMQTQKTWCAYTPDMDFLILMF